MSALQGLISYPGLTTFKSAEYTASHGIAPGICTLEMPQELVDDLAPVGDLTFRYEDAYVTLYSSPSIWGIRNAAGADTSRPCGCRSPLGVEIRRHQRELQLARPRRADLRRSRSGYRYSKASYEPIRCSGRATGSVLSAGDGRDGLRRLGSARQRHARNALVVRKPRTGTRTALRIAGLPRGA